MGIVSFGKLIKIFFAVQPSGEQLLFPPLGNLLHHMGYCPRCMLPLTKAHVADVDLAGCKSCGGLWLDNLTTRRVLESMHAGAMETAKARGVTLIDGNSFTLDDG